MQSQNEAVEMEITNLAICYARSTQNRASEEAVVHLSLYLRVVASHIRYLRLTRAYRRSNVTRPSRAALR